MAVSRLAVAVAATLLLAALVARAEPLRVGATLEPFSLETQHGETVRVGPDTRLLLVTHDMDAGDVAKAVLAEHTGATLAERGAVYVADISRMPGLVSRLIAIPRMRGRPYPVLLDREGMTATLLPVESGKVTAVRLEDGTVTQIAQLDSEAAVREALAARPAAERQAAPAGSEAP